METGGEDVFVQGRKIARTRGDSCYVETYLVLDVHTEIHDLCV